jgi:hypothetical protein
MDITFDELVQKNRDPVPLQMKIFYKSNII